MSYVVAALRSALFWLFFLVFSVILSPTAALLAPFSGEGMRRTVRMWSRLHRIGAHYLLGQRVVMEGTLPTHPCLLVFKHESMFETLELPLLLHHPAIFAKAELLNVPVWGWVAHRYGLVPVERDNGPKAMRAMLTAARAMLAAGRPLCLFAEGTRVAPGASPPLKPGFAGLYSLLNVEVVPVAVRSGHVAIARKWIKWPGTITYRVGAPIPPGLPRDEAEARVHAAINAFNPA